MQGRLQPGAREIRVELLEPYSGLSASLPLDPPNTPDLNERVVSEGQALLARLYHIADYANEHQLLLRDILSRIFQKLELLGASDSTDNGGLEPQTFRQQLQRELRAFFAAAFPLAVPEDCWEPLLRLIAAGDR